MHIRPFSSFESNPFHFLIILSILFLSYSITFAEQVVISPDKVTSPTFRTSTATCYGSGANTHINLGFVSSVTGSAGQNKEYCTVGGGYGNTASGGSSTIAGGYGNTASGGSSTIVGGHNNTASGGVSTVGGGGLNSAEGDYSWAGGRYMRLTSSADHTFVWGYSITAQSMSTANAFLIFPAGTVGRVGIGTINPGSLLEVNGAAAKPGGGSWSSSSDERLKDITANYDRGLKEVLELKPITFFYKRGNSRGLPTDEEYVGFIAQEVQEVFPEAVSEGPDGYLDFNMHPVNVAVVNAIKELKAENEALRAENETLKKDIEKIKAILGI